MDDLLHPNLLRDLTRVVVVIAELAWTGTRNAARTLAPLVRPPRTLRVRSDDGREFTGVVLIEGNDIIAGVVVCVGRDLPPASPPYTAPRPSPSSYDDRDRSFLRPWSDDQREEDEPWRR